jgi:hypothetical protein
MPQIRVGRFTESCCEARYHHRHHHRGRWPPGQERELQGRAKAQARSEWLSHSPKRATFKRELTSRETIRVVCGLPHCKADAESAVSLLEGRRAPRDEDLVPLSRAMAAAIIQGGEHDGREAIHTRSTPED